MVNLYSLTAPATERKEAAARMAGKAYEKRKMRAAQVAATRGQVAADAEVDPLPDKPHRPPEILALVDVASLRGRRSLALDEAPAADVPTAASLPYVHLEDTVQAGSDAAAAAPNPAAAGSFLAAAAAGQTLTVVQPNPKTGKSRERYEIYKVKTALAGLEALKGANFPGTTRPVFRGGATALSGDFAHDVARGFYTFMEAKVSPTVAQSVPVVRAEFMARAAPARSFGVKSLNRVAAWAYAMPRGPLSEDEAQRREV
jgi:hypothetical protein